MMLWSLSTYAEFEVGSLPPIACEQQMHDHLKQRNRYGLHSRPHFMSRLWGGGQGLAARELTEFRIKCKDHG